MPLINLRTDLKSLKYGKDTVGGGYSGQPYIQAKIPDGLTTKSPDFLLRNGFLAPVDALEDIKRLGKMFGDLKSPNGLLFIAKQNILSNSAVRTQTSGVVNEGVYTPLSTLAQAGVVAFGGHLNKQGVNPFRETGAYAEGDYLYFNKINKDNLDWINSGGATSLDNRLFALYESRILNNEIGGYAKSNNINVILKNTILSYRGGPGSTLGVGNTNIRFADQRTGKNNAQLINSGFFRKNSVGNFSVFERPNDRTTDLFISPYGVSNAYESITNKLLPGSGSISINGGYTFDPSFYNNVYQSGSLNPYAPLIGSKTWTPKQNNPDSIEYLKTLSFPSINNNGVSGKYLRLTGISGKEFKELYNSEGQLLKNFSVYDPAIEGNTWPKNSPLIYVNNTFTYDQTQINRANVNPPTGDHLSPKTQDFRKVLRANLTFAKDDKLIIKAKQTGATPDTPDYQTKNIETRTNIGGKDGMGPGSRANKSYVSYTAGAIDITNNTSVGAQDLINALPIYRSNAVAQNSQEYPVNDLVKFRIAAIDGSSPNFKTFMHFRAFIDSFNDTYNASWGSVKYLGRGENFYNYQGFDRTISLSFTVAAQSKPELIPMYKKLNYLASNLAPDYSPYGYMRGPLVQLTMGGYLYEQVGFISSLTYDIPNDTPWEIGINDAGDNDPSVKELPHRINVSNFSFTPIHNFVPGKQGLGFNSKGTGFVSNYGNQRYIALTAGGTSNYSSTQDVFIPPTEEQLEEQALIDQVTQLDQLNSSFNI